MDTPPLVDVTDLPLAEISAAGGVLLEGLQRLLDDLNDSDVLSAFQSFASA